MKVLLIAPPEINILPEPETSNIRDTSGCYPPLGLLYISSYLRKNSNHQISVLDAHLSKVTYEQLEHQIKEIDPDIVGIQSTTFTIKDTLLVAKLVKKVNKNIHVNIGGPHVLIYPKETLSFLEVDSLTIGEGEVTFTELVDCLEQKKDLKTVKGIAFKIGEEFITNEPREFVENLDELPFPARDLLPIKDYYSRISKSKFLTTFLSSRISYQLFFFIKPAFRESARKAITILLPANLIFQSAYSGISSVSITV